MPSVFSFAQLSPEQERAQLEKELKGLEEKIRQYELDITRTEAEKQTLQYQIDTIRKKINQLDLQIQQGNLTIRSLGIKIQDTEVSIDKTIREINYMRQNLANVLRILYEEDQKSLVEVLLTEQTLSGFFDTLMALESLDQESREILVNIKELKVNLEAKKVSLDSEKGNLEKVVQIQYAQKQQAQTARAEQERLLRMTEAQYQQYLKEKQEAEKAAAEIRARLFRLIGIPDVKAPTFGEAIEVAQSVTRVVNIRPAFLLGVISAESALGRNVGQCYVTNRETGGGIYIQSNKPINRIMNPIRDLPIFLRLTGSGFSQTPVSCWIPICSSGGGHSNNVSIDSDGNIICPVGYVPWGWGGAMGPAQFIPSTWLLYEGKITSLFGVANPNPWNVRDAFSASALYLQELGAGQKTLAAESAAANRYSGGYSWYASDVMRRAGCIQDFFDKGTMSTACQQLIF